MDTPLSVDQKAHLGRIAAKQFLKITDLWQLTDDERRVLAGAATRTTISTWRKRVKNLQELQLGNDTYERLQCIAAIERSLEEKFFHQPETLANAIRQPLNTLDNHSLLDNMLNGRVIDLYTTKNVIDTQLN
jgi:hypothetical protein